MTILVADDSGPSRELMREVLEAEGHVVLEAAHGRAALEVIRNDQPDLVFIDLQMPTMDGFGVLRELRKDRALRYPPVVAVTASAMLGDRERAIEAGFDSYIAKPFELRAVRNYVRSICQSRALQPAV